MTTTVTPSSELTRSSSFRTSAVVSGSSALVDSSASGIEGLVASARAMPTRCWSFGHLATFQPERDVPVHRSRAHPVTTP